MKPWMKFSLIFAAGILLGSAFTVGYVDYCMNRLWMNSGNHDHVLARLSCELKLTADQKAKVAAVLAAEDPEIQKLRQENRDQFRSIRDKVDKKIRPLLTPDQVKKLDEWKDKRDQKTEKPGFLGSLWFLSHTAPPPPDNAPASCAK